MIRGCALMNLRRFDEAKRVFARLCVILPEDTICPAYYAMARDEQTPEERLTLGLDVPRSEAVNRTCASWLRWRKPHKMMCMNCAG